MVALFIGLQVRRILWEQETMFNKGIPFLLWIKLICIEYIFIGEY